MQEMKSAFQANSYQANGRRSQPQGKRLKIAGAQQQMQGAQQKAMGAASPNTGNNETQLLQPIKPAGGDMIRAKQNDLATMQSKVGVNNNVGAADPAMKLQIQQMQGDKNSLKSFLQMPPSIQTEEPRLDLQKQSAISAMQKQNDLAAMQNTVGVNNNVGAADPAMKLQMQQQQADKVMQMQQRPLAAAPLDGEQRRIDSPLLSGERLSPADELQQEQQRMDPSLAGLSQQELIRRKAQQMQLADKNSLQSFLSAKQGFSYK
jgi:hypothetical protein